MAITLDGTTGITAAGFDGTIDASNLTGTLPAIDGSALTGIDSGGITLLGTLDTTSGASVTLGGLDLTGYKQVYYVLDRVSLTAANDDVCLEAADFEHRVGRLPNLSTVFMYAHGSIDLLSGVASSQNAGIFDDLGASYTTSYFYSGGIKTTYSQSSTSITFLARSSAFDAGSIKVYGVA